MVKSSGQQHSEFEADSFVLGEDTLPYRILYPQSFDPQGSYPLVLFLHGAGERGSDNYKQLTHGISRFTTKEALENFPCIVIAPQCPEEDYWSSAKIDRSSYPLDIDFDYQRESNLSLKMAIALVKNLMQHDYVDNDRIYLTGLSMGGMGSFEAIYREPELFSAAAIVCGGGDAAAYGSNPIKTRFWIFHGTDDIVVKVDYSREMHTRLQELGADVRYTEYAGVNHNSWENAYAEPDFLKWLFKD